MADQLQLRGGTTTEHASFTGALREVTVDIDKDVLVVHDGVTAGGHPVAAEDLSNVSGTDAASKLNNQTVAFSGGAAATPSVTFNGDTNTGIYSPGADQVAISTNGTGRLFVDASGNVKIANGNLYLGPAGAEGGQLEIRNPADTGTVYTLDANTASNARLFTASNNTDLQIGQLVGTGGNVKFYTGASERLRITSDGKLGLGSSLPAAKLHLATTAAPTGETRTAIRLTANNTFGGEIVGYLNQGVNAGLAFSTVDSGTATERMRITPTGVGVGTTTPGNKLSIRDGDIALIAGPNLADAGQSIRFFANGIDDTSNNYAEIKGGLFSSGTPQQGYLRFSTSGSERARIDTSGRLLVGTSSAVNTTLIGAAALQVAGTTNATAQASISRFSGDGDKARLAFLKSRSGTVGTNTIVLVNDTLGEITFHGADGSGASGYPIGAWIRGEVDGTPGANDMPGRLVFSVTADGSASPSEAMRINNAGELLVGYTSDNGAYKLQVNSQIFATSAIIATSDGRYKENVATLDGCVDLVKALRPVSFDWKHQEPITRIDEEGETVVVREAHNFPDGTQVGFIAQEVETVLAGKPWLGSVIKQNVRPAVTDNDGNELAPEEEFLGIAEGNLVAVLTSALKEAIGEIESLKARVAVLEAS